MLVLTLSGYLDQPSILLRVEPKYIGKWLPYLGRIKRHIVFFGKETESSCGREQQVMSAASALLFIIRHLQKAEQ